MRKKSLKFIVLLILLICGNVVFVSCNEDYVEFKHDLEIVHLGMDIEKMDTLYNGDTLKVVYVPLSDFQFSSLVLYWDTLSIASTDTLPYTLMYPIRNQSVGYHKLSGDLIRENGDVYECKSVDFFVKE